MIWTWHSCRFWRLHVSVILLTFLLGNLAMFVFVPVVSAAGQEDAIEFRVKAAMLYKFLDYIEWPLEAFPKDNSPYIIAVIGADAIAAELREIARHRTVRDRRILVAEIDTADALTRNMHMLFMGSDEDAKQESVAVQAEKYSIVIVTENPEGLGKNSVINLRIANGRVTFDVSLAATAERNLKVSARMLAVASSVEPSSVQPSSVQQGAQ
jgi:hypothetical protein